MDPPHGSTGAGPPRRRAHRPPGRWVRLEVLSEADIDELYLVLADPAVYAQGYLMHRRPVSLADARDLTRAVFLAGTGH